MKRVMIVDDDPHILISVRVTLEDAGYDVITAETGECCISELQSGFTGVILLDIMMPVFDGWDTIRAIMDKHLDKQVLISMLTAKIDPDEKMIGLEDYVFDYITKPFDPETLVERVKKYFEYLTS